MRSHSPASAPIPKIYYWELFNVDGTTYHAVLGDTGQSAFHLSCSDEDMNGPEDCDKPAGDGKGMTGYINQWIFEGMAGNGLVLTCTPSQPASVIDELIESVSTMPDDNFKNPNSASGLKNAAKAFSMEWSSSSRQGIWPGPSRSLKT